MMVVIWGIKPCKPVINCRRFCRAGCLHLQYYPEDGISKIWDAVINCQSTRRHLLRLFQYLFTTCSDINIFVLFNDGIRYTFQAGTWELSEHWSGCAPGRVLPHHFGWLVVKNNYFSLSIDAFCRSVCSKRNFFEKLHCFYPSQNITLVIKSRRIWWA